MRQNISVPFNGSNQFAEIVGDTARELQCHFPFLRLQQFFLQLPLRRHIARQNEPCGATGINQILRGHFDFDYGAILFAMARQLAGWKVQTGFSRLGYKSIHFSRQTKLFGG